MATTTNGLWYPDLSTAPNVPLDIQKLGQSVDTRYGGTVADWTALLAVTSPFPSMRVFVTSLGGVATYNGTKWIAPDLFAVKPTDESVTSSTTLQNDDHLLGAIPAAGTYLFDLYAMVSGGNAAGDIKFGFTFPTGTLHFMGLGLDVSLASGTTGTMETNSKQGAASGTTIIGYGISTTPTWIQLHGILIATAAGTLQTQWAQVASSPTASKVLAGSHLVLKPVA